MSEGEGYRQELLDVVARRITQHPRSLQKLIGPSGIGTLCDRKLAFRLAQSDGAASHPPAWRPTVGTATHSWLTDAYLADNVNYSPARPRWVTALRVNVGEIDGETITGELDLYDAYEERIVDWKIPGPTSLRDKKRHGPGQEYRVQTHLYGRGARRMGLPVSGVGILFMPSAGELTDSYFWSEAYDERCATDALDRATALARALDALGRKTLMPLLPTSPDHCGHCPWFLPGTTDLGAACPGDPSMRVDSAPALSMARPTTTQQR